MNRIARTVLTVAAVAGALAAGYWWGTQHTRPVETATGSAALAVAPKSEGRKVLYYRNPMGLPDTSPVPKKDPMGMDYIPVYEGEEQSSGNQITISTEKVQRLGVRTEAAGYRVLTRTVRAVGTLQVDERRVSTVSPKFEGWIERLHVSTTGQHVTLGQPLMEVYSPDLVTAQQEYLIAAKGIEAVRNGGPEIQASMQQLRASALARLRNWDISDEELQRLEREGVMRRTITLRSPVAGVVTEKPALKGMRFMPGEALYQIADLSGLWLLADIFEQDLGLVRPGQTAKITVNAFPDRTYTGRVAFFYPTVTAETRTGKVRIELSNPGGVLKPAMYASVELASGPQRKSLAVPSSAVIDSGIRRIVLVQLDEGRFEPRDVKTGARADDYVEITEGVKQGERVVVTANFLIDAESNLKAAVSGFQAAPQPGTAPAPAKAASVGHRAEGSVEEIDAKSGNIRVTHGPVPSLKWPGMTMDFVLANPSLGATLKPGTAVMFEFVERKPGEYVITTIKPKSTGKPAAAHAGH